VQLLHYEVGAIDPIVVKLGLVMRRNPCGEVQLRVRFCKAYHNG